MREEHQSSLLSGIFCAEHQPEILTSLLESNIVVYWRGRSQGSQRIGEESTFGRGDSFWSQRSQLGESNDLREETAFGVNLESQMIESQGSQF